MSTSLSCTAIRIDLANAVLFVLLKSLISLYMSSADFSAGTPMCPAIHVSSVFDGLEK